MNSAYVGLAGLICFYLAYRFYGQYLSNQIFGLDELDQNATPTPAKQFEDGIDFVPTHKQVLIGHHFSSIAGAAPIVGPAVAIIWGWVPALLWIILGVIFMGACHDFGALVLSMKFGGKSIGDITKDLIGPRSRILFLLVIFFLIWMVTAVFALVIADLFISFPAVVLPINFEIIVAVFIGIWIYRKKGNLLWPSILAQIALLVMIVVGTYYPLSLKSMMGADYERITWISFLMIYGFIASILPVWVLLQPRDFINSHQLTLGLTLMILGLFITHPAMVAPAFNLHPKGAPPWFPFLFITIACGAISGFHGLVSGGTSSKQVQYWKDAKPVGYGSMLGEALLALLATLAVAAGFSSSEAWHHHYENWGAAQGMTVNIKAFVIGASHFLQGLYISKEVSEAVIAVLIISFAATSLDTACRIQRYIVGEFGDILKVNILKNRYIGSGIAVGSAFALMISSEQGKGGLKLWPLFGATNQMLAGLTLTVITVYLIQNRKNFWPYLIPAIFVITITALGLFLNIKSYYEGEKTFLLILGLILFLSQFWIITEGILAIKRARIKANES